MDLHSRDLMLNFGFEFEDLYQHDGLVRLDGVFLDHLKSTDPALHARLVAARENPSQLARKDQSELIVDVAPHLEDFIGRLFGITAEVEALQAATIVSLRSTRSSAISCNVRHCRRSRRKGPLHSTVR